MKSSRSRHSDEGRIQVSENSVHGSFHPPKQSFCGGRVVPQDDGDTGALRDPLLDILTEIRTGNISQNSRELLASRNIAVETDDHTELFTRNISVDKYNTDRLNAIREDIFVFEMQGK